MKIKIRLLLSLFFYSLITVNINAQKTDSLKLQSLLAQAVECYHQNEFEKCRDLCLQIIAIDSTRGDAYLLIGADYAAAVNDCADNEFIKGMIYCLAVDNFEKAKEIDPSLSEKADGFIKVYSNYFPSGESGDVWDGPVPGQKFKIGCWINEETIVRFRD